MSILRLAASRLPMSPVCSTTGMTHMRVDVVSIFVEYFQPLRLSLVGKAIEKGIVDLQVHDLRDWTADRHRTVEDTAFRGGGHGDASGALGAGIGCIDG